MTVLGTAVICVVLQRFAVYLLTKVTGMDTKGKRSRAKKIKVEPDDESFIEKENARPKRFSKKSTVNYCGSDDEDTNPKRKIPNTKGKSRDTGKKSTKSSVILDQKQEISATKKESKKMKTKKEYDYEEPEFQEPEGKSKRKNASRKPKANNKEDSGTVMEDFPVPKEKDRQKKSKAKKTKEAETDVTGKENEVPVAKPKATKGRVGNERSRTEKQEVITEGEEPNVKSTTKIVTLEDTEQNVTLELEDTQTSQIKTKSREQYSKTSETSKKKKEKVSTDKGESKPSVEDFSKDTSNNNDHSAECSAVIRLNMLESEDGQQNAIPNNSEHETNVLHDKIIIENKKETPKDVLEKEKQDRCRGHVNTDCISTHNATESKVDAVNFDNSYVENICPSSAENGCIHNEIVTVIGQAAESLNSTYVVEHIEPSEHETKDSLNGASEPVTSPNPENVSFEEQGGHITGQEAQQIHRNTDALQEVEKNVSNRGADVKCIVCGTRQADVGNPPRTDINQSDGKHTQSQKQEDDSCTTKKILENINVLQEQKNNIESVLQHIATELDTVKCYQKEATKKILCKLGDTGTEPQPTKQILCKPGDTGTEPQPTILKNGDSDLVAREEVDILWEKCRTQNHTIRALHEELFTARKDQTTLSDKFKKVILCLVESNESPSNNGLHHERLINLSMEEICDLVLKSSSK